jgi:hypothetical protein
MLNVEEIKEALHASRVVPLGGVNPHGPLGLEHLAGVLAQIPNSPISTSNHRGVRRPIELNWETWEKLDHLAKSGVLGTSQPLTASQVAAAIIEQTVAATPLGG